MNYKDAYCHLLRTLGDFVARLEQPQAEYSPMDMAERLSGLTVESEEIRIGQNPYPVHKASRRGSSMR